MNLSPFFLLDSFPNKLFSVLSFKAWLLGSVAVDYAKKSEKGIKSFYEALEKDWLFSKFDARKKNH